MNACRTELQHLHTDCHRGRLLGCQAQAAAQQGMCYVQNGLVTQAAMAAAVQAARQEEQQTAKAALDKAHAEGQRAVAHAMREGRTATKRAVAYAIAKSKLDKTDKINVLQTLSEQPSDIFMVKAYYERHTNVFHFDFNERMRQRRRERFTAESMSTEDFDDSGAVDE